MLFKTDYRLIQVKVLQTVILSTFIKLSIVIKTFVLSIFEWPFYAGFTVYVLMDPFYFIYEYLFSS